jgi:hypothetical protein
VLKLFTFATATGSVVVFGKDLGEDINPAKEDHEHTTQETEEECHFENMR